MKTRWYVLSLLTVALTAPSSVSGQSVGFPTPRLLTTVPMGGQAGTSVDVTISGEYLENVEQLLFSHPGLKATPRLDGDGKPVTNVWQVSIADNCPVGIHEARVMTRLGVSSSRVFSVGVMPEMTQTAANRDLTTAQALTVGSVCNAVLTRQAVDYYSFEASSGQRIAVDCSAAEVDSRAKPVLILADQHGADLMVERRGGTIDFTAPETGRYVIKVHDLTFAGGTEYFYRLTLRTLAASDQIAALPSVRMVNAFSWPPVGLSEDSETREREPNNRHSQAEQITLPCDIGGTFFPAADVDTFEFTASAGEVWWVEVASERLGRPTDPSIVVQHISGESPAEIVTDVVELSDIPSPVKTSSNGYAYDGPPYNAGSADIIGQLEIKADGVHRLQLRDLFGGTRNDPRNSYRLVIRKAAPDFALVGWALHMELRNGDRAAVSKPIALRGGMTMPIEVVAIRRDGFNGAIELRMDGLPEGVSASGLTIPAGQSRGMVLITADQNAPRSLSIASISGFAVINDDVVTRECHLASMQWPVRDASQQIPSPRLLADVPVSVCGSEFWPITIGPADSSVIEVTAGTKLTIPLRHTRRSEFSGPKISLKSWSSGLGNLPGFDASLTEDTSEAIVDLAALKTPPGEYVVAFYGGAVAKFRHNPEGVATAEAALKEAQALLMSLSTQADKLMADAQVEAGSGGDALTAAQMAVEKQKAAVAAAEQQLKDATTVAQPKDIVDIIVSQPITIRVIPAEKAVE